MTRLLLNFTYPMIKNYVKIAWRNLIRQKLYSIINILGLTIGISAFLLIYLYIQDELTYDQFHPNSEQIYRMSYLRKAQNGDIEAFATSGPAWAPRYRDMLPEVTDYVLLTHAGYPGYINRESDADTYMEPDFKWASDNFFQFFDFKLVKGRPETVLSTPNAVVLTEASAHKYFGQEDPIGQDLVYNVSGVVANLTVTGIMKDPPANSHIKPSFIGNIQQIHQLYLSNYQFDFLNQNQDAFAFTYIKISDPSALSKISQDWKKHLSESFANNQNVRADAYHEVKFTAIKDMHFEPEMKFELEAPAKKSSIPIFMLSAILVLLIACINFMNLATARSAKRAKEIGLRKTLGSTKSQLIAQFYSESFLITTLAVLLSLGVFTLSLPFFNDLTGKAFLWSDLATPQFGVMLFSLLLLVGLVSGSYPALYLSSFNPLTALRGFFAPGRGAEMLRKGLVVFQFAISIILIISTMVVYQQLQLIHQSNLGKDKDRILSIRLGGFGLGNRYEVFKEQIEGDARYESVSVANHLPRLPHFGLINQTFGFPERDNESIEWNKFDVDFDFVNTFDLEIIAGRDFSEEMGADSNGILLNAAAVKALAMEPHEVVGMTITDQVFNQQLQQQVDVTGQVIGVVADFPYKSVNTVIEPLVIWGTPSPFDRILYVKMTPGAIEDKLQHLTATWKEIIPGMPMENWFMDFEFGRLYEDERRMSKIFLLFSGITIFIAVLGLFALTSYTTEQRKKEIGVRKVLGASEGSLIGLLLAHFFKLVAIAFVVALPIAYISMNNWLNSFVYRTDVSLGIMLWVAALVTGVTLGTVGYSTYKAAISNPIKTLRVD